MTRGCRRCVEIGLDVPPPEQEAERHEREGGDPRCHREAFLLTGDPAATDPVCHLSPSHQIVELALREPRPESSLEFRVLSDRLVGTE